jgi:hypothetical protein
MLGAFRHQSKAKTTTSTTTVKHPTETEKYIFGLHGQGPPGDGHAIPLQSG